MAHEVFSTRSERPVRTAPRVNVVAIADDVFKFVASASRDVTGEVPHREQQHPGRDVW